MPCQHTTGQATCEELENSMQHMVAINSGPLLHIPDLPSAIQNYTGGAQITVFVHFRYRVQQTIAAPTQPRRAAGSRFFH